MTKVNPGLYYVVCNKEDLCYSNHTITKNPPYVKWVQFGDTNSACLFSSEEDAQVTMIRLQMALLQLGLDDSLHVTWRRLFPKDLYEDHPDYNPDQCFDGVILNEPGLASVRRNFR